MSMYSPKTLHQGQFSMPGQFIIWFEFCFSFFYTGCLSKAKEASSPYCLLMDFKGDNSYLSPGISMKLKQKYVFSCSEHESPCLFP